MTPVRQLRVWENFVSSPAGPGTDPQKEVGFDALLGTPVIACFVHNTRCSSALRILARVDLKLQEGRGKPEQLGMSLSSHQLL